VTDATCALFRAYPAARERIAWRRFVEAPTPIEPLALPGVAPGTLFVKRDDRSCALYGGNKPRKLEFVIGHAVACGSRTLVTTGGLGTNHGLATTILGAAAGLGTVLVLLRQPITAQVRRTLLLHAAYGARHVWGRNVGGTAVQVLRVLSGAALRGERPYLVATGGSSARGDLGFVSAGLELAEQVRAGVVPEPARIYVPVGTGGTLAGLVAGLRLAGLRSRVVGVLVTDILPPSPARLARASSRTLRRLRAADPSVPALRIRPADFDFVRDQLGPGYGASTADAERAVDAAGEAGLRLETTYTGKSLAALLAHARGGAEGPFLFWNTFNGVDVAANAPRAATEQDLPPAIRRVLARAEPPAAASN
jgi:D-cysteine desulfhydrase